MLWDSSSCIRTKGWISGRDFVTSGHSWFATIRLCADMIPNDVQPWKLPHGGWQPAYVLYTTEHGYRDFIAVLLSPSTSMTITLTSENTLATIILLLCFPTSCNSELLQPNDAVTLSSEHSKNIPSVEKDHLGTHTPRLTDSPTRRIHRLIPQNVHANNHTHTISHKVHTHHRGAHSSLPNPTPHIRDLHPTTLHCRFPVQD